MVHRWQSRWVSGWARPRAIRIRIREGPAEASTSVVPAVGRRALCFPPAATSVSVALGGGGATDAAAARTSSSTPTMANSPKKKR
eukprot:scaffold11263_cov108-Isochrysis_galbana.AAC.3